MLQPIAASLFMVYPRERHVSLLRENADGKDLGGYRLKI